MILNMVGGGGGTKLFAAIGVTYPEGSTVTCTNGTKTLTAKTTSGQWVFAIPEAGTWTVTATDGTNSQSQSVSITAEGQFESVELTYELVLFDCGAVEPWTARQAGPTASVGTTLEVVAQDPTFDVVSSITTTNKIDVTKYNTLFFDVTTVDSKRASVGLTAVTSGMIDGGGAIVSAEAYTKVSETGVASVDVSEMTGEYYVYMATGGHSEATFIAKKVWLE